MRVTRASARSFMLPAVTTRRSAAIVVLALAALALAGVSGGATHQGGTPLHPRRELRRGVRPAGVDSRLPEQPRPTRDPLLLALPDRACLRPRPAPRRRDRRRRHHDRDRHPLRLAHDRSRPPLVRPDLRGDRRARSHALPADRPRSPADDQAARHGAAGRRPRRPGALGAGDDTRRRMGPRLRAAGRHPPRPDGGRRVRGPGRLPRDRGRREVRSRQRRRRHRPDLRRHRADLPEREDDHAASATG